MMRCGVRLLRKYRERTDALYTTVSLSSSSVRLSHSAISARTCASSGTCYQPSSDQACSSRVLERGDIRFFPSRPCRRPIVNPPRHPTPSRVCFLVQPRRVHPRQRGQSIQCFRCVGQLVPRTTLPSPAQLPEPKTYSRGTRRQLCGSHKVRSSSVREEMATQRRIARGLGECETRLEEERRQERSSRLVRVEIGGVLFVKGHGVVRYLVYRVVVVVFCSIVYTRLEICWIWKCCTNAGQYLERELHCSQLRLDAFEAQLGLLWCNAQFQCEKLEIYD
jgi:hypothetical protein